MQAAARERLGSGPAHIRDLRSVALRLCWLSYRNGNVFVNQLALVIVLGMTLPIRSGNRLRGFVSL
jgi:hypothetical protein